jgi:hypothetical protein
MFQVTKRLKEKEIKRQEHIYEFILTEKHHCLTLRVMQKVWASQNQPCNVADAWQQAVGELEGTAS